MIPGINFTYCFHFVRHYLNATRIDVLHSPFVFSIYNTCIKRQPVNYAFDDIELLRKQLKADGKVLLQKDFGAGSSLFSGKKRSVRELVYLHAKQARLQQIFYYLIKRFKYTHIIELGTSLGLTTAYLAKAAGESGKVFTIEGSDEIAKAAQANLISLSLPKAHVIVGTFEVALPQALSELGKVDLAYIDGNHQYQPTLDYFHQLLPHVHNTSVLIFDDIYWSTGMAKAWKEIKKHPDVTVTLDLFFVGLVFFRKEQAKEHFRLRVF
jgi:predicted O-methyltransferase YrrM